jgi:hypothetical protein
MKLFHDAHESIHCSNLAPSETSRYLNHDTSLLSTSSFEIRLVDMTIEEVYGKIH